MFGTGRRCPVGAGHDVRGHDSWKIDVENDVHNFWKIKYLSVSLRSAIVPKRPTMSVKVLINN